MTVTLEADDLWKARSDEFPTLESAEDFLNRYGTDLSDRVRSRMWDAIDDLTYLHLHVEKIWKCACGWSGTKELLTSNPSGSRTCPNCGASGGLI